MHLAPHSQAPSASSDRVCGPCSTGCDSCAAPANSSCMSCVSGYEHRSSYCVPCQLNSTFSPHGGPCMTLSAVCSGGSFESQVRLGWHARGNRASLLSPFLALTWCYYVCQAPSRTADRVCSACHSSCMTCDGPTSSDCITFSERHSPSNQPDSNGLAVGWWVLIAVAALGLVVLVTCVVVTKMKPNGAGKVKVTPSSAEPSLQGAAELPA